jgi:2-polyprenyl-3-methyl-5-hydroxy-6-metoxy-1,4-benzoquinol methylase
MARDLDRVTETVRYRIEASALTPQERNRLWWEALPMTYADWDAADRAHLRHVDDFLEINPFLKSFDFARFKGLRVIDIGCGAGPAAILFAKAGADATAVDLTANATRLASANALFHQVKVNVCRMDAEELALKSGVFDFAFAWGSLHHSSRPSVAFSELARILTPAGGGLVMVYNKHSARYYLKGLYWLLLRGKVFSVGPSFQRVQAFFTDGYYQQHFSRKELAAEFERFGLALKSVRTTHMAKRMLPLIPRSLDKYLKRKVGLLLVAEVAAAQSP